MSTVKVCPNCKHFSNGVGLICSVCGGKLIDTYCETQTWNNLTPEQRGELYQRTVGISAPIIQPVQREIVNYNESKSVNKKSGGCLKAIAIFIGLVIIANIINARPSGSPSNSSSSSNSSNSSSSSSSSSSHKYYHPGQKAVYGDLEITFSDDLYFSDYLGGSSSYPHADKGECYAITTVTIKNTGSKTIEFDDYQFTLIYTSGGKEYSYLESWTSDSVFYHSEDRLIPLQEISGLICFYVPEEVRDGDGSIVIRYGVNSVWTTDYVYWKF